MRGAAIDIREIRREPDDGRLSGWHIDEPTSSLHIGSHVMAVRGWVVGRHVPVAAVHLACGDDQFRPVRVSLRRHDVAEHFRSLGLAAPGVETSGFAVFLSTLGLPLNFEIRVRVTLEGGDTVDIASIRADRTPIRSAFQPARHPLILVSDGRSGTTWTSHLLGQHPEILAYRPFVNEPRMATYWMEVLAALAQPSSYLQTVAASNLERLWWLGDLDGSTEVAEPSRAIVEDVEIDQWFVRQPALLAAFCQERVESFYDAVAELQRKPAASLFVETSRPNRVSALVSEMYSQAREVLLVRDFRDKVASTIAFRIRLGDTTYGDVERQQQHVRGLRTLAIRMLQRWQQRGERAFLLRYEDLVERPRDTLFELLKYVGVTFDSQTIKQMLEGAQSTLPDLQAAHATSANSRASIGRWRNDLDPSVAQLCHELLGEPLRAFGYDT